MKMTNKNIKENHENTYMAIKNLELAASAFSEACFGVSELTNIKFPTSRDSSLLAARRLQREMQKHQKFFLKKNALGYLSFDEWLVSSRLSIIKCFELAMHVLWRYLKLYGEVVGGMTFENNSPKAIVCVCHHAKIIDELEAEGLIFMIEGRNNTSHIYKEEIAQQIFCSIEKYYKVMKNIIDRLKPSVEM